MPRAPRLARVMQEEHGTRSKAAAHCRRYLDAPTKPQLTIILLLRSTMRRARTMADGDHGAHAMRALIQRLAHAITLRPQTAAHHAQVRALASATFRAAQMKSPP